VEGRALRPYPPVVVEFDGALAPATVENIDPIAVEWKKRDRRKTKISLPSDPDEAVETGTEYVVRHGPPGFVTETVVGDDTATTGSFNLDFKGYSRVEFFARRDGYESTIYAFDTVAENGAGASVAGALGAVVVTLPMTAAVEVRVEATLPEIAVTFSDPINIEIEDIPTITVTAIDGGVDVTTDITEFFIVGMSAFDGAVEVGTSADTSGDLATITMSGLEADVSLTVEVSGDLDTVVVTNEITTDVTGEVDKEVTLPTVNMTQPEGEAEGAVGGVNKSILLASSGAGQTLSTASTTTYVDITGHHLLRSGNTESHTQLKVRQSGTIRKARVLVPTNGRSTATVMKLRVNGADSAISVSCTGSTTGWFEDAVNEVSVTAGDLINLAFTTGTGSGNFVFNQTIFEFEADTGVITYYSFNGRPDILNSGTTTLYNTVQGGARGVIFGWTSGTRSYQNTKTMMGAAQTLSNLSVDVPTNTSDVGATWTLMKNGSATSFAVSVGAGVTGRVENTSDTLTIAPGDYLEWRMETTGRTTGGIGFARIEFMSTSTDGEFDILGCPLDSEDPGGTHSAGNPNYGHLGARTTPSTTEALRGIKLPFAMDFSRFRASASSAGSGFGAYDIHARLNGSNTAMVVSVPSGGGLSVIHEDNTNTASGGENDILTVGYTPLGNVSGLYMAGVTAIAA
jgi:hypothetical protein